MFSLELYQELKIFEFVKNCLQSLEADLKFISLEYIIELLISERENNRKDNVKIIKDILTQSGIYEMIDNMCLDDNRKICEIANNISSDFFDKEFIYFEERNNFN